MPLTITYWPIRGLVQPALSLLEYLEIDYTFVPMTTDFATWAASKPGLQENGLEYPNLPYLKDGDIQLSKSKAIYFYIAKIGKRADMLPTTEQLPAYMMHLGVVSDLNLTCTKIAYGSKTTEELKTAHAASFESFALKWAALDKRLGSSDWVFGDNLTVMDFILAETVEKFNDMEKENGLSTIGGYENVQAHLQRFLALETVKAYRNSSRFAARPYNGDQAVWK